MTLNLSALALTVLTISGCTTHYYEANLNNLSPGWSKQQFLTFFGRPNTDPPVLRAAKRETDTTLIEVFTLTLQPASLTADPIPYWFVFRNGTLERWGRPEDWATVSATYNVNFNPLPAVK